MAVDRLERINSLLKRVIAESMFKAAGRVVAKAASIDEKRAGQIPSTKGLL